MTTFEQKISKLSKMYKGKTLYHGSVFYTIQDIRPPKIYNDRVYFHLIRIKPPSLNSRRGILGLIRFGEIVLNYFGLYVYWIENEV